MIVDCESCHTRFKLDESRIPATGAKVRCSRCKAAFIVQRPTVTAQEVIDEVVAEATDPGFSAAPETTNDLFETSASVDFSPESVPAPSGATPAKDEQWEFEEAPRPSPAPQAAPAAAAPARRQAPPTPTNAQADDDLDSLGAPADWDLLRGAARQVAQQATFRTDPAPEREVRAVAAPVPRSAPEASIEAAVSDAAARAPERDDLTPAWRESLQAALGHAVEGAGWIAAAALCAIGLALALAPLPLPSEALAAPIAASFEGAPIGVTLHSIESAVAGNLTVVRGELPASAGSRKPARLRAVWVAADGTPVAGARAIAGPPLALRKLRELSLARLQAEHAAHALELSADGAFEAVFGALPPGAERIAITREAVAPPASPPVASAQPEDASATASSRPTSRPSSE